MVHFPQFYKRHNFCVLMFAFFAHQFPSENGSTLKGKHFLQEGLFFFIFRTGPFSEGSKTFLTVLFLLKVYLFPLIGFY